jgi:hypothetical protein
LEPASEFLSTPLSRKLFDMNGYMGAGGVWINVGSDYSLQLYIAAGVHG